MVQLDEYICVALRFQVACLKCASHVISTEATLGKQTDIIPGPVESNGNIFILHLIYLDSNKAASERFKTGTTKHDILKTGCHLIWGRLKSRPTHQHSSQVPSTLRPLEISGSFLLSSMVISLLSWNFALSFP